MANMGAIIVDIMANTRQFQRNMTEVQKTMQKVGQKMQDIGKKMTVAITLPILAVGTAALKSAMDLEATEAKYKTVFGNMTGEADKFIKKFKELTPITTSAARSMTSGIQDLLIPMGFLRENATKLTGEFTHLIGALTNFNSATHSAEDVALAFQSAITGEYTPLKSLGIQLDVTTIKAKALEMGLIKQGQELSRQGKLAVLLSEAYKQSGDALAAYNKESLDTITKLKLLTTNLKDTSAELAIRFLPTVIKIIDKINVLADRFANLSPAMQNTILIVGAVAAALGPLLMVVGAITSTVITLIPIFKSVALAIGAVLSPVVAVVAAIMGFATVLVVVYKKNEKFRNQIQKSWGAIAKNISSILEILANDFKSLVDFISDVWDKMKGPLLDATVEVFGTINSIITGALDTIIGVLQVFISLFTGNWRTAWQGIINITKGALKVVNGMLSILGLEIEAMENAIVNLENLAPKKKPKPFDVVALALEVEKKKGIDPESLAKFNKSGITKDIDKIQGLLNSINFDTLEDEGVSAFDKLSDATSRYVDMLKNQIDTFKQAFGIFDKPQIERISGERLFVRMQAQTKLFEKWQKALDVIRGKLGASSKLFQKIAMEGPAAAGQVIGLAGLSAERLATLEQGMSTRGTIATDVSTGLVKQQMQAEQISVNLNGGVYVGDMAELANLISRELKLSGVT